MEDYQNSYSVKKPSSVFNISQSSCTNSRQLSSPRTRTIEELLRQKYTSNPNLSKDNSFTISSPAAHLEQVLSKSRFTKRSNDSGNSATPRFLPREASVSIKDLEKKIREKEKNQENHSECSLEKKNFSEVNPRPVTKQSMELIQKLREEVRNRVGFLEPEEPPDLLQMNVLERNNFWLQAKKQKIEEKKKEKKDKELDGCTFKPILNIPRLRTPISHRSKSPNMSYSVQYARKKNFRSNSTGKISARSTPKATSRDSTMLGSLINAQLSPNNHQISYKSGFNMASFLSRAHPVVDYKYFK